MKRQLKIIGTMLAIVLGMFLYLWILSNYPNVLIWFFSILGGFVLLFIFYAAVASSFED